MKLNFLKTIGNMFVNGFSIRSIIGFLGFCFALTATSLANALLPENSLLVEADSAKSLELQALGVTVQQVQPGKYVVQGNLSQYATLFKKTDRGNVAPVTPENSLSLFFDNPRSVRSVGKPLYLSVVSGGDWHAGGGPSGYVRASESKTFGLYIFYAPGYWGSSFYFPAWVKNDSTNSYFFNNNTNGIPHPQEPYWRYLEKNEVIDSSGVTFYMNYGDIRIVAANYSSDLTTSVSGGEYGYGVNYVITAITPDALDLTGDSVFKDVSLNEKQITVFGDAKQFFAQSPLGGLGGLFDGNGDYLTISPKPLDGNPTELTIEAWIYMNALPTYGWPIVSQSANVGEGGQQFFVSGSGNGSASRLRFLRGIGAGNSIDLIGATNLPLNEWVHVAVTFDGGNARLFVNGKLDGTVTANIAWTATDQPFFVGRTFVPGYPQFLSEANGKISDLRITKNIARYRASFTPTKLETIAADVNADPYFSKVAFQLSGNEISGSNSFVDLSSASPKSITTFGDAKQVSDQVKFNPTAIGFDGNGDYLLTRPGADFDLNTNNWTIEFWIYPRTLGSTPHFLQVGTSTSNRTRIYYLNGALRVDGPSSNLGSISGLAAGRWQHIAVTKIGSATSVYLDGELKASANISHASGTENTLAIGAQQFSPSASDYFDGYIDDVRVTRGIDRYTGAFVPSQIPQLPTLVGDQYWRNVSLLANCDGKDTSQIFSDSSFVPKTFIPRGNVIQSQGEYMYGVSSCYFDGNGDYLELAQNPELNFKTSDFTIETWFYQTADSNAYSTLFANHTSTTYTTGARFLMVYGANAPVVSQRRKIGFGGFNLATNQSILESETQINLNTWYHVAVTRKNNIFSLFVNGKKEREISKIDAMDFSLNGTRVGINSWDGTAGHWFGYIDDLRVTRGVARYTEDFIVPQKKLERAIFSKDIYSNAVSLSLMSGTYVAGYETISENEIRIFQPIVIGASDTTFDNKKIIIDGTTVSISGEHTFNNIELKNGAVLTTPFTDANLNKNISIIAKDISIDQGSRIDVSGKGEIYNPTLSNRVGGSHGGKGGNYGTEIAKEPFGNYQAPITVGQSGDANGGGAIKIKAENFSLEGKILANGNNGTTSGGAGGSIWLDVKSLLSSTGNGEIKANGGNYTSGYNGSGAGGGRIAIHYETLSGIVTTKVVASGGTGSTQNGGAGTIYYKNKIDASQSKLQIKGQSADTNYTLLAGISGEQQVLVENAYIKLTDPEVFSTFTLVNSHLGVPGNLNLANSASFISSSSTIEINGNLTTFNNNLVVDGITLSLAKNHTFNSIHIK
ncbi:LamG domain-containing protein, partial [Cellvibrio mixtus]|uniref:LamG domain-containing protein n=1 Tax=Cellvibrio mixtus TaxID=39650 RepID=UPI00126A5C1F